MPKGFSRRILLCGLLVGLGFAALAVKLIVIQVRDRARLVAYADRQLRRTLVSRARRGEILDARGRPLAVSIDAPSLYANPREVADPRATAKKLARVLGVPAKGLARKLRRKGRYAWLRRKLTPQEGRRVRGLKIAGLGFVTESRRFYPKRELASSLLGFVGMDESGLSGLEQAYEKDMAGRPGRVQVQRDGRGRTVHPEAGTLLRSRRGADIRLTVDEVLQYILEKELRAQLDRVGARRAVGVMVEPASGRVLAMATVPGFNPNVYGSYPRARWRQAAVQDIYEPGSTFKLVTAAAYFEAGGDPRRRIFAENGLHYIGPGRFRLRDHKKFGWLTAEEAIVQSSNIATYKMALEAGPERLHRMARRLGMGRATGVGFPGEASGILRRPKRWSQTSLAAIAIGQEVGVTPLQMVMVAAAVANGGVLVPPRIVDAVEREGEVIRRPGGGAPRRVFSRRTARLLARVMRRVVTGGTGRRAEVPGYGAAGKTGTAQKIDPATRTYSPDKFIMSFLGYVPFEKPRFALLVILDEGEGPGGAWGGSVAAPVWRRIAWQALRYLRVPPRGAQVWTVAAAGEESVRPSGESVSLGERVFRLAAVVREALHGSPGAKGKERAR